MNEKSGVNFVGLEGAEKDKVVVIGDGVDAARLATTMRKKVGQTDIISVAEKIYRSLKMAAVSHTEATNLTTPSSDNNNDGNDTNTTTTFSISPVTLQKLPHLKDYIPQEALKTQPNPLERNPFYHPSQGFYISHSDVVLRHIVFDLFESFIKPFFFLIYF
ncbi:atp-dependent 6-phosphofructokinase 2 [Quercus suber]|uniref:Atp-dependent 6-phosphofructokinase 2 n=1 Tax=Quercus suber TaxID=58331 RepID=A0AAW0LSK5_QUESU